MTVLSFVESSEFRKETARILARKLIADVGLSGLLDGSPQTVDDLMVVLAADLEGLGRQAMTDALASAEALGLAAVDQAAAQATLEAALARVLGDARVLLEARVADLTAAVDRMVAATTQEAVAASLASEATQQALLAPITAVMTAAAAGAINGIEADIRAEAVALTHEQAVQGGGEPPLFDWETLEDEKVCDDIFESSCRPRHGKQLTYDEWQVFGMPGDPNSPTICAVYAGPGRSFCRCWLKPAGTAAATPVNISEAAKVGRQRALKEAA